MKIAVIGCGRMGGWLARELARSNDVAVFDADPSRARDLRDVTLLDGLGDLPSFGPELLLNAVPLERTIDLFRECEALLPPGCVRADIASVKGGLPEYYAAGGFRWVSVHPMFGPTFARLDALADENAVIIRESDTAAAAFFRDFFEEYGLNVGECTFAEHDRLMAYSLTLPFVASLSFAACLDERTVPGTTFARHRQVAEGLLAEDDSLLAEILFNPFSLRQLDHLTGRLEFLKHIIRQRDKEEAVAFIRSLRANLHENGAASPPGRNRHVPAEKS
jgi:prephenate dehydrogenase